MPKRIQLHRTKGWRLPEGRVVVSRPSRWGNPFTLERVRALGLADDPESARAASVVLYRAWIAGSDAHWDAPGESMTARARILADAPVLLGGHDLGCWCSLDGDCHADLLLELANPSI